MTISEKIEKKFESAVEKKLIAKSKRKKLMMDSKITKWLMKFLTNLQLWHYMI